MGSGKELFWQILTIIKLWCYLSYPMLEKGVPNLNKMSHHMVSSFTHALYREIRFYTIPNIRNVNMWVRVCMCMYEQTKVDFRLLSQIFFKLDNWLLNDENLCMCVFDVIGQRPEVKSQIRIII